MSQFRFHRGYVNLACALCAFLFGIIFSSFLRSGKCLDYSDSIDDHDYLMVILVLSAPQNIERRNAMRETWFNLRPAIVNGSFYQNNLIYIPPVQKDGFLQLESVEVQQQILSNYNKWLKKPKENVKVPNLKIKHFFAVGTEGLDQKIMNDLRAEQNVYSDLLMLKDLKDSYSNLTVKLTKSFDKVIKTTLNFKYLLKCDDDTYAKLDLVAQDLLQYDRKLNSTIPRKLELFWGYFNGRARIKKGGQWQESNYNLCEHYLPYALGGGYVLSRKLVKYIADHGSVLSTYVSEDISVGTWLAPFKHIHRRHDPRFDTAYMPRDCKTHHIVRHKKTIKDMQEIYKGNDCFNEIKYVETIKKPVEYFYDWKKSPVNCCDNLV